MLDCQVVLTCSLVAGVLCAAREGPADYESGSRAHGSNQRFRRPPRHIDQRAHSTKPRLSARILEATATVKEHCARGRLLLGDTVAIEGLEPVASAGLAAVGEVEIERRVEHVAGVSLEHVDRSPVRRPATGRGYGIRCASPALVAADWQLAPPLQPAQLVRFRSALTASRDRRTARRT